MSAPTDRNRLAEEASAYLLQHADNPVHWQPWDDDALAAARDRDVPIFCSIGYAACHWCHVMEEESFVDDAVARRLNDDFVPIKVDREERPDVDRVYQTACQLLSGRGGWPLSAFCTPAGKPFLVGTYFPREPRRGTPGFLDVLEDVAESWADPEERAELEQRADRVTSRVREELESVPDAEADGASGDDGRTASTILGDTDPQRTGPGTPEGADDANGADGVDGASDTDDADGAPVDESADAGARGDDAEPGPVERVAAAAAQRADREHGGWGSGPKFPQPRRIDALLDAGAATDDPEFRDVAVATTAAMVDGGLYDHVGGGFHRYCTDRDWTVPHFEKMLYDNAELPRVLLGAHQVTGRERFATVARETFDFLGRELAQPDAGYASTLDARSPVPPERTGTGEPGEDEEGAFYVWTPSEVADALAEPEAWVESTIRAADAESVDDGPLDDHRTDVDLDDLPDGDALADLVCERYGVTDAGNFEGTTVLTVDASLQALAEERDRTPAEVRDLLDLARVRLREVRGRRPRPRRDEKVIAAWNGLAIRALAEGSIVLEDGGLAARARRTLDAVRERLWDGDRLARRYVLADDAEEDAATEAVEDAATEADVAGDGYLEDYAFLGRGALACYEATGDVDALGFALDLADAVVDAFYDDNAGTLYATPAGGESLIARPQEPRDQSTPSSLADGTDLLAALDAFVPHDRYREVAERVVRTHAASLDREALQRPSLALAAERLRSGSTEVTIAAGGFGTPADDDEAASSSTTTPTNAPTTAMAAADALSTVTPEWGSWLADAYLPRRLLAPRPATEDGLRRWLDELGFDDAPPIWAGREATDGPTAFVCRGFTCSRPLDDPDEAGEWLGR